MIIDQRKKTEDQLITTRLGLLVNVFLHTFLAYSQGQVEIIGPKCVSISTTQIMKLGYSNVTFMRWTDPTQSLYFTGIEPGVSWWKATATTLTPSLFNNNVFGVVK